MSADGGHRELSRKAARELTDAAFDLEQKIKSAATAVNTAWWDLSRYLYEFHEQGYWGVLGYDTLDEFLVQPDLGLSRSQFFRMTKLWRDLVVTRQIPVKKLEKLEPSKVREVAPAIVKGDVKVDVALSDAKTLGYRDVRAKYNATEQAKRGREEKADGSTPLAAEEEPDLVQCESCGSWVPKAEGEGADE